MNSEVGQVLLELLVLVLFRGLGLGLLAVGRRASAVGEHVSAGLFSLTHTHSISLTMRRRDMEERMGEESGSG
jgi:hypothetical protein